MTPFDLVDLFFRFSACGIGGLTAAAVWRGLGRSGLSISFTLLYGGACLYLLVASDTIFTALGPVAPVLAALSSINAFAFWLTTRFLFLDNRQLPSWAWALPPLCIGLGSLRLWALSSGSDGLDLPAALGIEFLIVALVAHALYVAWRGRDADLIEARRRFRLWFVALLAPLFVTVIGVELTFTLSAATLPPPGASMASGIAIWIIMLVISLMLLRLRQDSLMRRVAEPALGKSANSHLTAVERRLLERLRQEMEDKEAFREERLTIAALAKRLGSQEHTLRRLINGALGYRNFNAFLNGYRIKAAKASLTDPDRAGVPVLTLSYESGFGSIGPFNRAFREATGMTPTEFRRTRLGGTDDRTPSG